MTVASGAPERFSMTILPRSLFPRLRAASGAVASPLCGRTPGRGLALICALLVVLSVDSAAAGGGVVLEVGSVLASNAGSRFDHQLARLRSQLEGLFQYTSYRLMREERREVPWGDPAGFEIPGGRYLWVTPKTGRDGRISLNLVLLQDSRRLIHTDLTLPDHGLVLVGGPRHLDGNLIISIGAASGAALVAPDGVRTPALDRSPAVRGGEAR